MNFSNYPTPNGGYKYEVQDSSGQIVGTAHVQSKGNAHRFWDLEDLLIDKEYRRQGYGTGLLNHVRDHLWNIDRLPIRVHPAVGQEALEEVAKNCQHNQLTEEERDAEDRKLEEAMKKPDFWEDQNKKSKKYNSEDLKDWDRKLEFTCDDPDGKHLWCNL